MPRCHVGKLLDNDELLDEDDDDEDGIVNVITYKTEKTKLQFSFTIKPFKSFSYLTLR